MIKTIFIFLFIMLITPVIASELSIIEQLPQPEQDAINVWYNEIVTCSVYYAMVSEKLRTNGDEANLALSRFTDRASIYLLKNFSYLHHIEITLTRYEEASKFIIKISLSNMVNRYGDICKTAYYDPDIRMNYWLKKMGSIKIVEEVLIMIQKLSDS